MNRIADDLRSSRWIAAGLALIVAVCWAAVAHSEPDGAPAALSPALWRPAVVVAALAASAWALLRYLRGRGARIAFSLAPEIAITGRVQVAGKWDLALVHARGRHLLVGAGADGPRVLADLTGGSEALDLAPRCASLDEALAWGGDGAAGHPTAEETRAGDSLEEAFFARSLADEPDAGAQWTDEPAEPTWAARPEEPPLEPMNIERAAALRSTGRRLASGASIRRSDEPAPSARARADEAASELALIRQRLARYRAHQDGAAPQV